jgi:hypothetical protein
MAVNKQKIEKLLREYFWITGGFSISDTGLVSVKGDVKSQKEFTKMPVSFDRVSGYFGCENAGLKTLVGAPRRVGGNFLCRNNQLKTLVGAPRWVGGEFYCNHNQLEKLEGAPRRVGGSFFCYDNQLKTLKGAPLLVSDNFVCTHNPLESLKGLPSTITFFRFEYNEKLALGGILTSDIKRIFIDAEPADLTPIIMKYLNTGYSGILPFAAELIRAGYGDNAWL